MQSKILKSDYVYDYKAYGHDGKTIWKYAIPFKSAIERDPSLGKSIADLLANPASKENPDGKLDWFIPFPPENGIDYNVISWDQMTIEQKKNVRSKIARCQDQVQLVASEWEANSFSKNTALFAHFLKGDGETSICFPGFDCVYLVDGKPVITFWGFIKKDGEVNKNAEGIVNAHPLTETKPEPTPDVKPEPKAPVPPVASTSSGHKHCLCALGALLLLLPLLLLLAYLLWWFLRGAPSGCPIFTVYPKVWNFSLEPDHICSLDVNMPNLDTPDLPELPKPEQPKPELPELEAPLVPLDADVPAVNGGGNGNGGALASPNADTPSAPENQPTPPAPEAQSAPSNPEPQPTPPELKDEKNDNQEEEPLIAPPELDNPSDNTNSTPQAETPTTPVDLDEQDNGGLNGHYSARTGIVDKNNSKPVKVDYDFKNGEGTATLTRSDGSKCTGKSSGAIKDGKLMIDGSNAVTCADGTVYEMPHVNCEKDGNGKTFCGGQYGNRVDSGDVYMELYKDETK